ncbi:DUF4870 domain-containing protein [Ornithinimicrobium murale]|uniref:DUF4870 domain-containing protein n=1 Tax=Ornithinimicrobium murale TaxID=1050153 RepID=UPI001EDD33CD|nr:DUF4870 domain-containing protein [Ornithinimicrobium murale]
MTDNPQWQPGQVPPPPNDPQQPPAGAPGQPGSAPQQGHPAGGAWQSQGAQPQGSPQGGSGQGQPAYQAGPMAAGDERTWMILAHVSAPIAMIVSAGWLSFAGPLLVWLVKKDQSSAVRQAASGAFNFNLAAWLMAIIGWICFFTIILIPVAIILWIIVFVVSVYAHLRGAWLASKGQVYTYPFQIRVLS